MASTPKTQLQAYPALVGLSRRDEKMSGLNFSDVTPPHVNFTSKAGAFPSVRAKLTKKRRKFGAGDRDRTGDIQLGKLAFYR
jgi:hypothetical protein